MKSVYPDHVVRQVLQALDALDVLEFLDYRPETILRDGEQLRMACPIHGEKSQMRTLAVECEPRTFRCLRAECAGSTGGDLIGLVALARRSDYDAAMRALIDEFDLAIELPKDPEAVAAALVEAENLLALMSVDAARKGELATDAHARIDRVLAEDPDNVEALRLRWRVRDLEGDTEGLPELAMQLAELERKREHLEGAVEILETELVRRSDNLVVRRRFAEALLASGATDRAFEQFMTIAETAEARGELTVALHAYRQIQGIGTSGLDVAAMITQLLLASDQSQEAVSELLKQAYTSRGAGDWDDAISALEMATEAAPNDKGLYLKLVEWQVTRGLRPEELRRTLDRVHGLLERDGAADAAEILKRLAAHKEHDPETTELAARLAREGIVAEGLEPLLLAHARRLLNDNRPKDAYELARLAVMAAPRSIPVREAAIGLCLETGRRDDAIEHRRALADLYEDDGQRDKALDVLRATLAEKPGDCAALLALASSMARGGQTDEATALLRDSLRTFPLDTRLADRQAVIEQARALAPGDPDWMLAQSELQARMGDRRGAARLVVQAARVLEQRGNIRPAIPALRLIVQRSDAPAEAILLLTQWMAEHGERPAAVELLRRQATEQSHQGDHRAAGETVRLALQWDSTDPALWEVQLVVARALDDTALVRASHEGLAESYRGRGRFGEAARSLRALLELDPENLDLREQLRDVWHEAGDLATWSTVSVELADELFRRRQPDRARGIMEQVVARRPADLDARERLVRLLYETGDDKAAIKALDAFMAACDRESATNQALELVRELAASHAGNHDLEDRLVELLQRARKSDEQTSVLMDQLARAERDQRFETAVGLLRRVEKLKPTDWKLKERLAGVLAKAGDKPRAAATWVEAARLAHESGQAEQTAHAIREALALDRDCREAWRFQASVAREHDQLDEARECLRTLAEIQLANGEYGSAEETANELLALNARDVAAHRLRFDALKRSPSATTTDLLEACDRMAEVYDEAGDNEAAFEARRDALRLMPRDEARRDKLVDDLVRERRIADAVGVLVDAAEFERHDQQFDRALECLDRALAIDSTHLGSRALRAQVLEDAGRATEALVEWRGLAPLLGKAITPRIEDSPEPPEFPDLVVRDYTFDGFVIGDRNRFAWATAKAVSGAPGQTAHNPLFLHADVGLGKTHLLHAIANAVREANPKVRLCYTSAEDFITDLIEAIQNNNLPRFRESYRAVEVLLIDDIHLLAGKERAQEEFFQLFNALYQARRQIVVTSDRHPRDIAHLEKRLVSRFGAGVIVDIQEPEFETRLAILKREIAHRGGAAVPDDALALMAQNVPSNVRELKGALNQLLLMHQVGGAALTPDTVRDVLRRTTGAEVAG